MTTLSARSLFALSLLVLGSAACVLDAGSGIREQTGTPQITAIEPVSPRPGDLVTIRGEGFGDRRTASWVQVAAQPFNDRPTVLSWSSDRIVVSLDPALAGSAELAVVVGGARSRPVPIAFRLECAPIEPFERLLDLHGVAESEAFDLARAERCHTAIVGRLKEKEGPDRGFFVLVDENGETLAGYPRLYDKVSEWRSILPLDHGHGHGHGYLLVGTSPKGDVALAEVDGEGNVQEGWPRILETKYSERVMGAILTPHQIAVVGTREQVGFLSRFDVLGGHLEDRVLDTPYLGSRRALGVTEVAGGFVAVGDRVRIESDGSKETDAWLARFSIEGELTEERYETTTGPNTFHAAVAAGDGETLLAVGDERGRAHTNLAENPGLFMPFEYDTHGDTLLDVAALEVAFVAAGHDRSDGILVHTDCVGTPTGIETVDLGETERLEAAIPFFPNPTATAESAYLAVGSSAGKGPPRAIFARRDAFEVIRPSVELAVNGGPDVEVSFGDSVELSFAVEDAWFYELRKVQGPGPDVDAGALVFGEPVSGSVTLDFDTDTLSACANGEGCAATTYEIVARAPGAGRCVEGREIRATVSVFFELDPELAQLVLSSAVINEKYGSFSQAAGIAPSHLDVVNVLSGGLPYNRCLVGLGIPYGTSHALDHLIELDGVAELDDRNPALVNYDSDADGQPTRLSSVAFGVPFVQDRPSFAGDDWVEPEQWEGHWGGWHTGEGGMTIVTDDSPGSPWISDWRLPPILPPAICPPRLAGCGAFLPTVPHPALWDVHVFYPPDGTLPRVEFTAAQAGVPDPCAALTSSSPVQPLEGCDTGVPSLGLTPFFTVGEDGQPIPKECD